MKQVTFSSSIAVHENPCLGGISDEERPIMWYNMEELISIRQECSAIVATMTQEKSSTTRASYDDKRELCTRGLERHAHRNPSKKQALQAVLSEQSMQRVEQVVDPEEIAYIYMKYSSPCQKQALIWAFQDRQEVEHARICDEIEDASVKNNVSNAGMGNESRHMGRQRYKLVESDYHLADTSDVGPVLVAA
jgi:hypothetical protein